MTWPRRVAITSTARYPDQPDQAPGVAGGIEEVHGSRLSDRPVVRENHCCSSGASRRARRTADRRCPSAFAAATTGVRRLPGSPTSIGSGSRRLAATSTARVHPDLPPRRARARAQRVRVDVSRAAAPPGRTPCSCSRPAGCRRALAAGSWPVSGWTRNSSVADAKTANVNSPEWAGETDGTRRGSDPWHGGNRLRG